MSIENLLWGAPRIHGELLKLGFDVAQSSVAAKFMIGGYHPVRDGEPSCVIMFQTLQPSTCLSCRPFKLLYAFVIVRLSRRVFGIHSRA
jgi:hypothetical protein